MSQSFKCIANPGGEPIEHFLVQGPGLGGQGGAGPVPQLDKENQASSQLSQQMSFWSDDFVPSPLGFLPLRNLSLHISIQEFIQCHGQRCHRPPAAPRARYHG